MRHYRIVAIAQIHNELRKGNLKRFAQHIMPLVDALIVYDDASTDGSFEYIKKFTPYVLRGSQNAFAEEIAHKHELLKVALTLRPDFVMYLDADEVLTANASSKLQKICREMKARRIDGMSFKKLNLWRSKSWRRVDNAYDEGWFTHLWRVKPGIAYREVKSGLHQPPYPTTLKRIVKTDVIKVLHYGFSSNEAIIQKYLTYRRHDQTGWPLKRLIDESTLTLERVDPTLFPRDLRVHDHKPSPQPLPDWYRLIKERNDELLRPSISIVSLIYKSTKWLQFAYDQVLRYSDLSDKEFFFVANDATEGVKQYLTDHYIPHYVFENTPKHKKEWYINNVYRAWNYAAHMAHGDYILFINSDMGFTPGWIENLFRNLNGENCVTSRLVESGKMPSGTYGISKNFGRMPEEYSERTFLRYAARVSEPRLEQGGLFMPLLIKREDLLRVGGYPEGNVVPGSDSWKPKIAKRGEPVMSGDVVLMQKLRSVGIKHITAFDSIVYHFQEGEMDDAPTKETSERSEVVIANTSLTGVMGEKTMWNFLLEMLPSTTGIDAATVGSEMDFPRRARRHIWRKYKNARIILQNASFVDRIDPEKYTIMFLQDNLREMGRPSEQQENNLKHAQLRVANSRLTADAYPEYNFEIIPIGVDSSLFSPRNKQAIRRELGFTAKKIGIFVGDLSPVKGWPEVKKIISDHKDIFWIIVSKSDERYEAPNVAMYNKIDQRLLSKLYNCADFFILGSPVETLCLSAIEAAMCNIPIVMYDTGIFADFTEEEKGEVGFFGPTLSDKIDHIYRQKFNPRKVMLQRKLTTADMVEAWYRLLREALQEARADAIRKESIPWIVPLKQWARETTKEAARHTFRGMVTVIRTVTPRRLYRVLTTTYDKYVNPAR